MAIDSLRTHLVDELSDLLDAETRLTKALPRFAASATAKPLKTAFQKHLVETRGQIGRLNNALRQLGEKPRRKTCKAMLGLLAEGETLRLKTPEGALRDAVMITAAQKVEHYEMASYGTARTYAQVLGEPAVARLLEQTLKEEKAADGKLTTIAEASVNEDAAEEWRSQDEDGLLDRSAAWIGSTVGAASRQLGGRARRAAGASLANDRSARSSRRRSASAPTAADRPAGTRRRSGARTAAGSRQPRSRR